VLDYYTARLENEALVFSGLALGSFNLMAGLARRPGISRREGYSGELRLLARCEIPPEAPLSDGIERDSRAFWLLDSAPGSFLFFNACARGPSSSCPFILPNAVGVYQLKQNKTFE
jgi:hypothetical protein